MFLTMSGLILLLTAYLGFTSATGTSGRRGRELISHGGRPANPEDLRVEIRYLVPTSSIPASSSRSDGDGGDNIEEVEIEGDRFNRIFVLEMKPWLAENDELFYLGSELLPAFAELLQARITFGRVNTTCYVEVMTRTGGARLRHKSYFNMLPLTVGRTLDLRLPGENERGQLVRSISCATG